MYFIYNLLTSVVPTSAHRQVLYCPILQNRWWPRPGSWVTQWPAWCFPAAAVSSHQAAATINTCSRSRAAIVLAPQPGNKQFVKLYHTIIPSIPSPQITSSVLRKRLDWLHCDLLFVNSARVPSLCYYTRWMPNEVNKNFPLCYPYKHIHPYIFQCKATEGAWNSIASNCLPYWQHTTATDPALVMGGVTKCWI